MNNANIKSDTDLSDSDLDKIDANNMNVNENGLATDSWPDEHRNIAEQTSEQGNILTVENVDGVLTSFDVPEVVQDDENHPDEIHKLTDGPEISDDELLKTNDKEIVDKSKDESTDESSWASYVESVYKEAGKANIDTNSITKLVDITESLKNQASDSGMSANMRSVLLDINSHEQDSLVQKNNDSLDMTPNEIINLVGINNNNIGSRNSAMDISDSTSTDVEIAESTKWSSVIDQVYEEAKHKGIEPKSISGIKVVDISNSGVGLENIGIENIDSLVREDNKMGFREGQISELYSNEYPNAADLSTINAIKENPLETTAVINDITVNTNNNPDNSLVNAVLTEAKKQTFDENVISKIVELPDFGSVVEIAGTDDESTVNSDSDEKNLKQERMTDETMTSNTELQGDTVDFLNGPENLLTNNNDIVDKQSYEETKWENVNTNDIENVRSAQDLSDTDINERRTEDESSKIVARVFEESKLKGIEPESIIKVVDLSESKLGSENGGLEKSDSLHEEKSQLESSDVQLIDPYLNVERDTGYIHSVNEIDKNSLELLSERHGVANSENNILGNSFIDEALKQEMIRNTDENSVTEIIELPASDILIGNIKTGINNDMNDIRSKQEQISDDKLSDRVEGEIVDLSKQPDGIEISTNGFQKDTSWQHIIDEVASNLNIKAESINKVVDISDSRNGFENDMFENGENGVYSEIDPTDVSSWSQQNNEAFDSANFPTSDEINADIMQPVDDQGGSDVNNDNDKEANWPDMINEIVKQSHNKDMTAESINEIIDLDESVPDRASSETNNNFNIALNSNIANQENKKAANWPNLVNDVVKQANNKDITAASISRIIDLNKWNGSSMSVASNINHLSPLQTKTRTRKHRFA